MENVKGDLDIQLSFKPDVKYGDVNGDGDITLTDATFIFQYCAHRIDLTAEQQRAADVDGDGSVTITDATWIFQYCAHRRTEFKVG